MIGLSNATTVNVCPLFSSIVFYLLLLVESLFFFFVPMLSDAKSLNLVCNESFMNNYYLSVTNSAVSTFTEAGRKKEVGEEKRAIKVKVK